MHGGHVYARFGLWGCSEKLSKFFVPNFATRDGSFSRPALAYTLYYDHAQIHLVARII